MYCGASASVTSTVTCEAPNAMAESHRSMPVLAVCHKATGTTFAGTPCALPSCAARPSPSTSCVPRSWLWNSTVALRPPACAYVESSVRSLSPCSGARGYWYVSAPVGHTVVQAPQPTHRFGLTTICCRDGSLRIACAEQISMQALQPTCSLRLCAHSFCLYEKNLGLSNSPTRSRSLSSVGRSV